MNSLQFLTHPTLVGRVGFLVGVLLVLCIAGLFVTVVSLSGIVYNHWDVIICCIVLLILFRMYRGRNRQTPRPLQEDEHKTN
jgi:Flp pilus assembly protein TadB